MDFERILEYLLNLGSDFAELRYLRSKDMGIVYVDGSLRSMSSNEDVGISIRVFYKGAWGFSATASLESSSLIEASERAFKIAKVSSEHVKEKYSLKKFKIIKSKSTIPVKIKFEDVSPEEKLSLVKELEKSMKELDQRIKSTTVRYSDNLDKILIINSFGTEVEKEESYISSSALAISLEAGKRGRGYEAVGGTGGFEILNEMNVSEIGLKAAKKAIEQLAARSIKPGSYVCLMDPVLVGVFAHEGIGHPSEADGIVEKNSVLEGKIGEKIADEKVTIIDNPLLPKRYGSFEYDDEGIPAKQRYIIKEGFLNEYLHSLETSSILGHEPNGAARSDSFLNPPIVRMSNIYFEKGDMSFDELLEGIELGIYAKGFEYGYVVPNNGQYTFKCEYGYLIEKGEIKQPLRDLSLSGVILETLKNVDGIGKDLEIKSIGNCGKEGQWVRVGDGGPHVRVKNIVVGGLG